MRLFWKTISVLAVLAAVFFAGSGFSMAHHGYSCPMTVAPDVGCPETGHSFAASGLCYEIVTKDTVKTPLPAVDYLPAPQPIACSEIIPDDASDVLTGRHFELLRIAGAEVGRKQMGFWLALHERKSDAGLS